MANKTFDVAVLREARAAFDAAQQQFKSELGRLRLKREKLVKEREEVATAPLLKSELAELMHKLVDREAEKYLAGFSTMIRGLQNLTSTTMTPGPDDLVRMLPGGRRAPGFPVIRELDMSMPGHIRLGEGLSEHALLYFLRDQIKAGLDQALEQTYTAGELSMDDRVKAVAELDAKIELVDIEIRELRASVEIPAHEPHAREVPAQAGEAR